jgi:predicted nucleic acid-binding protein
MTLYLDSSVLVAAFSPEVFTNRALDILSSSTEVVISELTVTETRILLIRKCKRGVLTGNELAAALAGLSTAIANALLHVEPLPVAAFRRAEDIAGRVPGRVRAMDALHVGMASLLGAELATFDADQATAAKAEGIVTHTESVS